MYTVIQKLLLFIEAAEERYPVHFNAEAVNPLRSETPIVNPAEPAQPAPERLGPGPAGLIARPPMAPADTPTGSADERVKGMLANLGPRLSAANGSPGPAESAAPAGGPAEEVPAEAVSAEPASTAEHTQAVQLPHVAEAPAAPENTAQLDDPEQLPQPTEAQQRAIIERGDRQLPDEPNRGFSIERLGGEPLAQPVPLVDALPLSCKVRGGQEAAKQSITVDLTRRLREGSVSLDPVPPFRSDYAVLQKVELPVDEGAYQAAVEAGTVKDPNLFGTEGRINGHKPEAAVLDALVDPDERLSRLEAAAAVSKRASLYYRDDLEGLKQSERDELDGVRQAFDITDDEKTVRLLNFSDTPISDEQLRQAVNVTRSFSDKSGGYLLDRLHTIAVLPEKHSSFEVEVEVGGEKKIVYANGHKEDHILSLSERVLQDANTRSQQPAYIEDFFDQYRLPGEPTEGPDSPSRTVSGADWEGVLAHELDHLALPPWTHELADLEGSAPTLYGRTGPDKIEHVAELGAAEYLGGREALAVPKSQREAKQEMWARYRERTDDKTVRQNPYGPRFFRCRELDLTAGPLPPLPDDPNRPVLVDVAYRLVRSDTPAPENPHSES